ncbi:MAG: thioredoxin family protein, partial [Actinomycetota bacterium]|nr:thioredoxin family protein [Actinomycetota bacterium]
LDTDENNESAARHGVQNMPTLVLFRDGREVQRMVGYAPKAKLQQQIDRALAAAPAPVGRTHG